MHDGAWDVCGPVHDAAVTHRKRTAADLNLCGDTPVTPCAQVATGSDVGLAFLLVTLAGLSTLIGAALVVFIRKPRPVYLAAALGLSAGVMMCVQHRSSWV